MRRRRKRRTDEKCNGGGKPGRKPGEGREKIKREGGKEGKEKKGEMRRRSRLSPNARGRTGNGFTNAFLLESGEKEGN